MKKLAKLFGWIILINVISWIVGFMISKKLTRGAEDSDEFSIAAVMGGKAFKSRASALRSGVVTTAMGGSDVDLREARLAPGGATLTLRTTLGGARVLVPDTWVIDLRHVEKGGQIDVHTTPTDELPDDAPHLVIDATTTFGGTQITTQAHEVMAIGE